MRRPNNQKVRIMKTPQVKPDWPTGIYIGNGVIAQKPMTPKQRIAKMFDQCDTAPIEHCDAIFDHHWHELRDKRSLREICNDDDELTQRLLDYENGPA